MKMNKILKVSYKKKENMNSAASEKELAKDW